MTQWDQFWHGTRRQCALPDNCSQGWESLFKFQDICRSLNIIIKFPGISRFPGSVAVIESSVVYLVGLVLARKPLALFPASTHWTLPDNCSQGWESSLIFTRVDFQA